MRDARGKTVRGKRSGKRHSFDGERQRDIHSRIDGLPASHHAGHSHNVSKCKSATAAVESAAPYFECTYTAEMAETHLIPRQSITRKQYLGIKPQALEFAAIPTRQLNKRNYDGKATTVEEAIAKQGLVATTENRLTWKSDRTLLRQGDPFKDAETGDRSGYKREGTVSVGLNSQPYRESIPNAEPIQEQRIGVALDDDPFETEETTITEAELAEALDL